MASIHPTMGENIKAVQGSSKAKPSPSYSTSRKNSSTGRMGKTAMATKTTLLPRANSNSRMPSGQGRNVMVKKPHSSNRTQMNNNNTVSRPRKPDSAGGQSRIMANGNSHQDRRKSSAEKSKRQGSGSSRRTPPKSRWDAIDKDDDLSSPDLQLEKDDGLDEEQTIQFIDVPGDRSDTSGSNRDQSKAVTICPKTILDQCQEREFNKVYEINLRASKISKINNLEKFTCLRVLDLSSNHIKKIENLDGNKELKELKLYDNGITEISNLESTRELSALQLQHNRIKQIGKGLSCLRKLSVLRLDSNRISKIESREMAPCAQLTYLDISSNTLDNLSPLNCLSSLEELHATHNHLTTIADLSRCRKLQEVDVSYNKVTDIAGLKSLPHLTVLNVSHNLLNTPCIKAIGKLKSLQTLDASHNRIPDLDSIALQFPSLEVLNVTHNKISKWATLCSLKKCENLSELYASGNPFCEQEGEKPSYHSELQSVIPSLEILDGANVKRNASKAVPVMRPMSATSVLSARQVENQLRTVEQELAEFGANLAARFESARTAVDSLPSEAPSPRPVTQLSIRSISTAGGSRPTSRCSSRRRIAEAQAYAAAHNF